MASTGDLYLPNLTECFAGQALVNSWTDTLRQVVRENINDTSSRPLSFLTSSSSSRILSIPQLLTRPVPTLPKPSSQSKTDFESKTAAINVTPSLDAPYSIDEIKDDTLWLSKCLDLDELECLRITLLEWQRRPVAQLQDGLTETEVASLHDALGSENYGLGRSDTVGPGKLADPTFDSRERRRSRLIALCMQEQGSMFRISAVLTDIFVQVDLIVSSGVELHPDMNLAGRLKVTVKGSLLSSKAHLGGISACLDGLNDRLETLSEGPPWAGEPFDSSELQDNWTCSILHQISALLELILLHQKPPGAYTEANPTLAWLRLMSEVNFFLTFEPRSAAQALLCSRIQALASTCTLGMLYLGEAAEYIDRLRASPEVQLDRSEMMPYFMDPDATAEIHQLMMTFAAASVVQAAPAVLAWGLILGNVREIAVTSKEFREASHVQKAIDGGTRDSPAGRRLSSSSVGSIQQSPSEDFMDSIRSVSHGEDDVDDLNRSALLTCHVFDYISELCASEASRSPVGTVVQAEIFQQLIITSVTQLEYTADKVDAQVALIEAFADVAGEFRASGDIYGLKVRRFREESGVRDILEFAASRFPYETLPFLQLCNSLARLGIVDHDGNEYIAAFLHRLPTFTQKTGPSFSAYHTTREYENANLVSLDAHLSMLDFSESRRLLDFQGQATELNNTIQSGTIGEVISENRPPVIKWHHPYSAFTFFGLWLDGFRCGQLQIVYPDQEHLEATAATILELLSKSLDSAHYDSPTRLEYTAMLLDEIDMGLPDDVDLASMVFDICEQQLQSLRYRKQDMQSCDLVVACLRLIATLLPLLPNRVWSSLSRSTLFDTRGTSSGVLVIILSLETMREEYAFFEAYADLYQNLVEDAVRQSVRSENAPTLSRVTSHDDYTKGIVPTRIVDSVIHALTRAMIDSFQAAPRWRFDSSTQRIRIITKLSQTFGSVLQYVYGVDDSPNLSTKLTAGLSSSAKHIADVLRPHPEEVWDAVCLLRWLLVSWQRSFEPLNLREAIGLSKQICAISTLTKVVIRVGAFLGKPKSALDTQMLDAIPVIIRLGTLDNNCCSATLDMLQALLQTMSSEDAPSLLGRLGSLSAKAFLESMYPHIRQSEHDKIPIPEDMHRIVRQSERDKLRIRVWDFFTSLVTRNQQWFAITLLTGSPPEFASRMSNNKDGPLQTTSLRDKSILAEALGHFGAVGRLNPGLVAAVLNFVVRSQIYWNWLTDSIQTHATLLPSLVTFVSNLRLEDSNQLDQSQSNKIAALVVELAAVQLHCARSIRDKGMIQKTIPLMRWLISNAINVGAYNASLHSNLRKNFSARYNACTLANFKRTQLLERAYGGDFFYDIDLAGKMLSHRSSQLRRPDFDQTFHQELIRVNMNLSLVDSQMALLDSFQSFCTEHFNFFSQDSEVQKMMATVVQNLLTANTTSPPSEQIFETLFQTRAEFALVMIRRLAEIKPRGSEFTGLLSVSWDALRTRNITYEFAIDNGDLVYFRTTLKVLLLAMQFYTDKRHQSHDRLALISTQRDPTSSIIIEVASVIVADGMKSVVSCIHDQATNSKTKEGSSNSSTAGVKDVSLILAVLQSMLRLHILPQIISQLGSGFVSSSIIQACFLLYSWSHTLTTPEMDNEPVYSELSLRFLVSLSSFPQIAEELAVEGVLSRISTARVTQLLRSVKGGASQFDKRPGIGALYGVWTTGILPLCLNLLHSVGRAMAGEVATFLNQFPQQLSRASKVFSYHGAAGEPLTLMLANEGAVLALISRLLLSYRVAGASAGVDAYDIPTLEGYDDQKSAIVEDVNEILVGGRLKVRATATSDKEAAWQKMREGKGGDKLEQAIAAELTNVVACINDGGQHG